jgi:hypothetical protein
MGGSVPNSNTFGRYNRKVLENAKCFSPDIKGTLIRSQNSWEGKKSVSELRKILGQNKSEELLRNIAGGRQFVRG